MKIKSLLAHSAANVLLAALPVVALAQGGLVGVTPFQGTAQSDLVTAVIRIVNYALILAALAAAVFIVYGGVKYITSATDEEAAESAKSIILYAVLGLIVIGLAAAIVNFVVTGIRVA